MGMVMPKESDQRRQKERSVLALGKKKNLVKINYISGGVKNQTSLLFKRYLFLRSGQQAVSINFRYLYQHPN